MIYESRLVNWVYRARPPFVQDVLVSAYGAMREGIERTRAYHRLRQELDRTQWLPLEAHRARQDGALRLLIRHAYDHVPFYRRRFDECRLRPEDIRSQEDLWKIPILTKDEVKSHKKDLHADDVPRTRWVRGHTGGTTGLPLSLRPGRHQVMLDRALTE